MHLTLLHVSNLGLVFIVDVVFIVQSFGRLYSGGWVKKNWVWGIFGGRESRIKNLLGAKKMTSTMKMTLTPKLETCNNVRCIIYYLKDC